MQPPFYSKFLAASPSSFSPLAEVLRRYKLLESSTLCPTLTCTPPFIIYKKRKNPIHNSMKSLFFFSRFRSLTQACLNNSLCLLVTFSRTNTFFGYFLICKFLVLFASRIPRSVCKDRLIPFTSKPQTQLGTNRNLCISNPSPIFTNSG